jgi:hypothetical protein
MATGASGPRAELTPFCQLLVYVLVFCLTGGTRVRGDQPRRSAALPPSNGTSQGSLQPLQQFTFWDVYCCMGRGTNLRSRLTIPYQSWRLIFFTFSLVSPYKFLTPIGMYCMNGRSR